MSGEMSGNVNRDDKDCHNAQVCDTASSLGTSIREAETAHIDAGFHSHQEQMPAFSLQPSSTSAFSPPSFTKSNVPPSMKRVAIADIFTHTNRLSNENRLLIIAFIHRSAPIMPRDRDTDMLLMHEDYRIGYEPNTTIVEKIHFGMRYSTWHWQRILSRTVYRNGLEIERTIRFMH